jgi:hypothetical protein
MSTARGQATRIAKRGETAEVVEIRATVGVVTGDGVRQASAIERQKRAVRAEEVRRAQWRVKRAQDELRALT